LLASEGFDAFYGSELAGAVVPGLSAAGASIITGDDLEYARQHAVNVGEPVAAPYHDGVLYTAGSPSAGGTLVLLMLAIAERLDLARRPEHPLCTIAEILTTGFSLRQRVAENAANEFLDLDTINRLAAAIEFALAHRHTERAPAPPVPAELPDGECTTHHSHVDSAGNALSMTQSIGDEFGSAFVEPASGLLLNNAMKLFDPRPGRIMSIRAGAKPLSSMAPVVAMSGGEPWWCAGSPSGTRIISALVQVCVHHFELGTDLAGATRHARVHPTTHGLEAEAHLDPAARRALEERGHTVAIRSAYDDWFGCVQSVSVRQGRVAATADVRRPGTILIHEVEAAG
jgi:gamma-glutamyltranspeptidase/glutathione hydrolase